MKYLVVLDAGTATGRLYADGSNDGYVSDGVSKHPVLDCAKVETDGLNYLFARRDASRRGLSAQSLYLPHTSVVAVHQYAVDGPMPLGYSPLEIED